MDRNFSLITDLDAVPSPCFVVDEAALARNLSILARVKRETGCRILLALKAFAMHSVFPLLKDSLDGTCASSLFEARLSAQHFGGEVHTFSAAYGDAEFHDILKYSSTVIFNSFAQWQRFSPVIRKSGKPIACGLRVNPEHSEAPAALYDPCAPGSRLGIRRPDFEGRSIEGITGLHFHTLCEQNADALERTLAAFEKRFGEFLTDMSWVNFGGGHHITRNDYDVDLLCRLIGRIRDTYGLTVYLEPGEAVTLNAGVLVATVLDVVRNDMDIAILDASAATHMPDVLEMPYRPGVAGAGLPGEKPHTYRLAGPSCLAGDVIGEYSFDAPLVVGSKVILLDMAHYTMVKTNMFNGINLPAIGRLDAAGRFHPVREFGYQDYVSRLS
jgi:carboxynorspermidine decarboxylase